MSKLSPNNDSLNMGCSVQVPFPPQRKLKKTVLSVISYRKFEIEEIHVIKSFSVSPASPLHCAPLPDDLLVPSSLKYFHSRSQFHFLLFSKYSNAHTHFSTSEFFCAKQLFLFVLVLSAATIWS